jgi:hypothetical protein
MLRVLTKDRKLDPLLLKKTSVIGAEDLKPKALVLTLLFEGLFPFRQGAHFVLGKYSRLGDKDPARAFQFLLLIVIVFHLHFPF